MSSELFNLLKNVQIKYHEEDFLKLLDNILCKAVFVVTFLGIVEVP